MKYEKMDKKLKTSWVKALRSGKYTQGTGRLCRETVVSVGADGEAVEDRHCCLGVLCEVAGKGNRRKIWRDYGYLGGKYTKEFKVDDDVQGFLSTKNDSDKWSFKRIATWIEKNL